MSGWFHYTMSDFWKKKRSYIICQYFTQIISLNHHNSSMRYHCYYLYFMDREAQSGYELTQGHIPSKWHKQNTTWRMVGDTRNVYIEKGNSRISFKNGGLEAMSLKTTCTFQIWNSKISPDALYMTHFLYYIHLHAFILKMCIFTCIHLTNVVYFPLLHSRNSIMHWECTTKQDR